MTLTVVKLNGIDDGAHHLIKKRQSDCNCFTGFACNSDMYYNNACGCMICGSAPLPPRPTTTLRTTTNSARCDRICVGRRRIPLAKCPSCLMDGHHYGNGYYCCGGNVGSSCGGRFTTEGSACSCRGTSTTVNDDCIVYDGGCGYFGNVDFDITCGCFYCA